MDGRDFKGIDHEGLGPYYVLASEQLDNHIRDQSIYDLNQILGNLLIGNNSSYSDITAEEVFQILQAQFVEPNIILFKVYIVELLYSRNIREHVLGYKREHGMNKELRSICMYIERYKDCYLDDDMKYRIMKSQVYVDHEYIDSFLTQLDFYTANNS